MLASRHPCDRRPVDERRRLRAVVYRGLWPATGKARIKTRRWRTVDRICCVWRNIRASLTGDRGQPNACRSVSGRRLRVCPAGSSLLKPVRCSWWTNELLQPHETKSSPRVCHCGGFVFVEDRLFRMPRSPQLFPHAGAIAMGRRPHRYLCMMLANLITLAHVRG